LAALWPSGDRGNDDDFGTMYQIRLVEEGHYVLPTLDFPDPGVLLNPDLSAKRYPRDAVKKLAAWKMPFTLKGTQWESWLYWEKAGSAFSKFRDLQGLESPNVIAVEGEKKEKLSPFGPVGPWREIGGMWTSSSLMRQLQAWYPNPPRVIMLSNNESKRLKWPEVEESRRYLDTHGLGHSDVFKRNVVAKGWIERHNALHEGMREGLDSEHWRKNTRFIAWDAFGKPFFGRWNGWPNYGLSVRRRFDPNHLMWDGASPSYYVEGWNGRTDHRVWSPQVESMNFLFMLKQVYQSQPEFWFELSIWEGNWPPQFLDDSSPPQHGGRFDQVELYRLAGQTYPPARYEGFVQFGMWLLRPRAVRKFFLALVPRGESEERFLSLVKSVDRVHENPLLRRFWRDSKLVLNRSREHPYQTNIPKEYQNIKRWYLLNTSLDPKKPWTLQTDLPVFSLARVRKGSEGREWLLYAHAPLRTHQQAKITVPGYGVVDVEVPRKGAFYHIKKRDRSVTRIEGT